VTKVLVPQATHTSAYPYAYIHTHTHIHTHTYTHTHTGIFQCNTMSSNIKKISVVAGAIAGLVGAGMFVYHKLSSSSSSTEHKQSDSSDPRKMRVLLVGGGHTNTQLIKHLLGDGTSWPKLVGLASSSSSSSSSHCNIECTLLSDQPISYYSGMVPGVVGCAYDTPRAAQVDLDELCTLRKWHFIQGAATRFDPDANRVYYVKTDDSGAAAAAGDHRQESHHQTECELFVEYDIVSIDIGSTTSGNENPHVQKHALTTRPISLLVQKIEAFEQKHPTFAERPCVIVVGAGAAGIELAFALENRFGAKYGDVDVTLVDRSNKLLVTDGNSVSACSMMTRQQLDRRGIRVLSETAAIDASPNSVTLENKDQGCFDMSFDLLMYATGAASHDCTSAALSDATHTPLAVNDKGFIKVHNSLQSVSHPNVFGAGDCISMVDQKSGFPPKAGVYAVRQGKVLLANVQAAVRYCLEKNQDSTIHSSSVCTLLGSDEFATIADQYDPQTGFLMLINESDGRAVGTKFGIAFEGPWVWKLKDWIDQSWMQLFTKEALTATDTGKVDFNPEQKQVRTDWSIDDAAAVFLDTTTDDFSNALFLLRKMADDELFRDQVCMKVVASTNTPHNSA
jgi:NADH dehydrogenase FAD-containing subunit